MRIEVLTVTKTCIRCKVEKYKLDFCADSSRPDGLYVYCKQCVKVIHRPPPEKRRQYNEKWRKSNLEKINQYGKEYRKQNPEAARRYRRQSDLKRKYGINTKDYSTLWDKQEYKCAICSCTRKPDEPNFPVDHNHISGKVRGILCPACNTGLGFFRDDKDILFKASCYVEN